MRPVLFEVFGWGVPSHEFFIGLGVLVATTVYFVQVRRRGPVFEHHAWMAIGALTGGAVFAHLGALVRVGGEADSFLDLWMYGGRSILGGLAGAYFGVIVTKRIVGYKGSTGDLFAPAVAIGIAIGRVGCFLTEQLGTPTALPWGVTLSPETTAAMPLCPGCRAGQAMHPSFVYEIAFHLLAFVLLWRIRDRLTGGVAFKVYLLAYGGFRFAVEFVRANPVFWGGLTGSQLFLLLTIPLLAIHVMRRFALVPTKEVMA